MGESLLGNSVKVEIDYTKKNYIRKFGSSIYHGHAYIKNSPDERIPAYLILNNKQLLEKNEYIVLALVNWDQPLKRRLIVAPRGFIYYEPEIKEFLSKIRYPHVSTIFCRYEKSCGAIVLRDDPSEKNILVVKNQNGNNWGFPKGHIEKGEIEKQTALREIEEETGLKVTLIDGFREVSDYYSFGSTKKRVVFFVAKADSSEIVLQKEELASYKWVTLEEAIDLLVFKNNINILKKAMDFINK